VDKRLSVWELEYTCAAHSNRRLRFSAANFVDAYGKARRILTEDEEHGPHGGYTHWPPKRLDFVTDFEESSL
jgi:hypothetical protein